MIEWSPLVLERAGEIADYIALDKPSAAELWLDGLFESVERLELHPMSGRVVPEVNIERIMAEIKSSHFLQYFYPLLLIQRLSFRTFSTLVAPGCPVTVLQA